MVPNGKVDERCGSVVSKQPGVSTRVSRAALWRHRGTQPRASHSFTLWTNVVQFNVSSFMLWPVRESHQSS